LRGGKGGIVLIAGLVACAAVAARLPALGTWWCLDDWGQLGRAAGLLDGQRGLPARWLSQQAWWSLTWPLLGADAAAHAWARILLHALAAVTLARIALRAGLPPMARLFAGLMFAATPIAFTPIYWASGIQELLGGTLALLAVERWLAGGRAGAVAAFVFGTGAILSKEAAFALPVFFVASLIPARASSVALGRWRRSAAAGLVVVAASEAFLVTRHFATGSGDPYALGGPLVMLGNLGKFGWWLPTPGPVFTAQVDWTRAGVGLAVLAAWGVAGALAWRRGSRARLAAWFFALLSLAPALPLLNQARPYMGYLAAAAGALTLATWWPTRLRSGPVLMAAMFVVTVLWGQVGMRGRIAATGADGLPADPVVRAALAARETAAAIAAALPPGFAGDARTLVIFQPKLSGQPGAREHADERAMETPRYVALSGALGADLAFGGRGEVLWTASLLTAPADGFVVCEKSKGFQAWGSVHEALMYAAVLHIAAGNHEQAAAQLTRAVALDGACALRVPEGDALGIPPAVLGPGLAGFRRWVDARVARGELSAGMAGRLREFAEAR